MRRLLPAPPGARGGDVLDEAYRHVARPAPAGRPWVTATMVSSVDGRATVDGRSGGLGGPGDRAVFALLRSLADVVLVGAGTVRVERYRPLLGERPIPIAIVSAALDLDWAAPLFTQTVAPTVVLTTAAADPARRARGEEVADVVVAGDHRVDVLVALGALADRGHGLALCEGGPGLLAQVAAAGALDELCLTVAPLLVAGDGPTTLAGPVLAPPGSLALASVLEDDGSLFVRYVRS